MSDFDPVFKIDTAELQALQDIYSSVANLFMFAVNESGSRVTEMSGDADEIARVATLLDEAQIRSILSRVLYSSVEEQVIEDTEYSNMKVASVGVRINGNTAFGWLICGFMPDDDDDNAVLGIKSTVSEANFVKAIDLIREISKRVYGDAFTTANAVADAKRAISSTNEMEQALRRAEAIAGIVSQLDSEESFEMVSDRVLDFAGGYSNISHAYVLRPSRSGDGIDIMGRYICPGQPPLDPVIDHMKAEMLSMIGDKTTVISYKSRIDSMTREWMDTIGITALVSVPIIIRNEVSMYVLFMDGTANREWSIEEIRFFGDAVKVLQSSVTNRIQRYSITSSFKSLETILDNVGNAIYVRDAATGVIKFANRVCKNVFEQEMAHGDLANLFENSLKYNSDSAMREVHYEAKNRWYDVSSTAMKWVDGSLATLFSIADITEKKQYQQKIEQQANNDFLTGLYNRMCCERDLMRFIDEAKATGGTGAVLYLDLDDFKHINDGLGHQYGDVLLKAISSSLKRINGVENSCYRMGGDEFVVIIPHTSYDRFEEILESIRVVFNKPWYLKGADYYCTSSMGIVTFPDEGDTVQDLIKKADIAMYEAKKSGKNKLSHYTADSDVDVNRRLDMEKSMRDAANRDYNQFEVYFQPIMDVRKPGNPCVGAEALVRWNSTDLGFVNPGEFIPLAEYLGLINPIGNHVLRTACMALKKWNENGHPYHKINVNLSVVQLMQTDIAQTISDIVKETGINPRNLTLEVTESLAINDMSRMKKIMNDIKKIGVRLALDDFGTGYSSLNHIREIPLDVIKVDQAFVVDLATDQYAQAFIKMIGELATTLGVKVCVEGIETIDQFRVLENMNVRMVQGFYFDRPMPQADFEAKYL